MFTDPTTQKLWDKGQLRAAYDASVKVTPSRPTTEHPFRDSLAMLEAARKWHEHGTLCWHVARFPEAGAVLGRAYQMRREALGEDHADTLDTLERLAALAHYLRAPDAGAKFADVVARLARVHGEDSVRVAIARRNQAACLRDTNKLAEARAILDGAVDIIERTLPAEHAEVVAALKVDAMLHLAEGTTPAAIDLADKAIKLGTKVWDAEHPFVAAAELIVARCEIKLHEPKAAAKRLVKIERVFERAYRDHPLHAIALHSHAEAELALAENYQRAEKLAREAIAMYGETYPDRTTWLSYTLFRILFESGRVMEAADLVLELGDKPPEQTRLSMSAKLANHLVKVGDYPAALPWLERTRDLCADPDIKAKWAAQVDKWARHVKRFDRFRDG